MPLRSDWEVLVDSNVLASLMCPDFKSIGKLYSAAEREMMK